eukprot:NODE_1277_length_2538_cov_6.485691.p1 GENE.NODE_1277_length_2538_cov_6.485691~~NODE_1277_length_2538_cov_6.485691.p1  ORF type:complete len:448 (+),score=105.58 NODE_1277_length_2538_cov_6.485691:696-2039(+)
MCGLRRTCSAVVARAQARAPQSLPPPPAGLPKQPAAIAQPTKDFTGSPLFMAITGLVIVANMIYMGIDSQRRLDNEFSRLESNDVTIPVELPEYVFAAFFALELLVRITAQRSLFLHGPEMNWNIFDVLLVCSSVYEAVVDVSGGPSVWRVFRLLRLVRLFKLIRRLRFFDGLSFMVSGIINCFVPLLWIMAILFLILYASAVFFLFIVINFLQGEQPETASATVAALSSKYSCIYDVMCLLFEGITGGTDWADHSAPLKDIHPGCYVIFCVYVFFVALGVLNVINGFFVDSMIKVGDQARKVSLQELTARKVHMIKCIRHALHCADPDCTGELTRDELALCFKDPRIGKYFYEVDISAEDLDSLFCALDTGDNGVTIDDFIEGLNKMITGVNGVDICSLLHQTRRLVQLMDGFAEGTRLSLVSVGDDIATLHGLVLREHSSNLMAV